MRIAAGSLKGRHLAAPRGVATRPTADRVRIALLDALAPRLPGAHVLDLFAGAGGVGLEALSRGAATATLVERDGRAVAALRANVQALGLGTTARIARGEVGAVVVRLAREGARFDLVFLDPPYDSDLVATTLARLAESALLVPGALVVAQHFSKRPVPTAVGRLRAIRTRRFGETTLTFFRADDYDSTIRAVSTRTG